MPSSTLSLFSALLAFSSSFLLAAAAPSPAWYLAPTGTSSSAAPAKTTTSSLVWYKADPTTSSKPSPAPSAFSTVWYRAPLPSSSAAPPAALPTDSFLGYLNLAGGPVPVGMLGTNYTEFFREQLDRQTTRCPEESFSSEFRALNETERAREGVYLSEAFYEAHGGLSPFCGRTITLSNPYAPSSSRSPTLSYTITRGCFGYLCPDAGVGAGIAQWAWISGKLGLVEHRAEWPEVEGRGKRPQVQFRFE
ncbi:hypothetical protein JCM6882_008925 [Rhodosporidiobolus microsporus]